MGSGTDGKWYRWKVSSMENDVWKGSSDGKCRRMGNVPMGNSGDPSTHIPLLAFFVHIMKGQNHEEINCN